jgi:hypothetical protein
MGGVSFHPGGYRALVEVELQPKGYAAFLIYTLSDRTSLPMFAPGPPRAE